MCVDAVDGDDRIRSCASPRYGQRRHLRVALAVEFPTLITGKARLDPVYPDKISPLVGDVYAYSKEAVLGAGRTLRELYFLGEEEDIIMVVSHLRGF